MRPQALSGCIFGVAPSQVSLFRGFHIPSRFASGLQRGNKLARREGMAKRKKGCTAGNLRRTQGPQHCSNCCQCPRGRTGLILRSKRSGMRRGVGRQWQTCHLACSRCGVEGHRLGECTKPLEGKPAPGWRRKCKKSRPEKNSWAPMGAATSPPQAPPPQAGRAETGEKKTFCRAPAGRGASKRSGVDEGPSEVPRGIWVPGVADGLPLVRGSRYVATGAPRSKPRVAVLLP